MFKLILPGMVLFLSAMKIAGQTYPSESQKELLLSIQKSKEDTNRISLQLKLGNYYFSKPLSYPVKPNEYKRNQDSAIKVFYQALALSIKLKDTDWQYSALDMIAQCERESDPEHSKQTLLRAVTYYHQKGNISKEAHALESLAGAYFKNYKFNDNVLQKIRYLQRARSLYLQNYDPAKAAGILTLIAAHRIPIQQYDLAEKELQQSLAEYKAAGYKKLQFTYMTLVDLEYARGNNYRAIAYCSQGIKSTVAGENLRYTSYFYWNAARGNFAVKKYQGALDWLQKAIDFDKGQSDYKYLLVETLLALNRTEDALGTLNDIAKEQFLHTSWDTLNQYRDLALYHTKKNNTDLAVRYYLKSLEKAEKVFGEGGYSWLIICYNGIADLYLKTNQAAKAEKYIKNAALTFKKAKTIIDPAFLVDFYNNSYKYDVATGNYRAAFKNAKTPLNRGLLVNFYNNSYRYDVATGNYRTAVKNLELRVRLQDSLYDIDKEAQLAELDIQNQTAQQEQSIKFLHSQSAAQQARLEKANLQRNITIGGIIVMFFTSGLFYKNYKQKQAANSIINQKNNLLQHLLTEKEWLVKEIHHRVKNNLQIVMSLLNSQSAYIENEPALTAIQDSQHRVHAMSLIHQKLYGSENLSSIDMCVYIRELVSYLADTFNVGQRIHFAYHMEALELDVSQAVPLGLILNEAITNSIKYAFPDGRSGIITISLSTATSPYYILTISDNGIGMPSHFKNEKPGSLGMSLMAGLSEDLNGSFSLKNDNGSTIKISFVHERSITRPETLAASYVSANLSVQSAKKKGHRVKPLVEAKRLSVTKSKKS
jgi:two-component sensor histidine kinase